MPQAPAAGANPSSHTVCSVLCQYIGTEGVTLPYVPPTYTALRTYFSLLLLARNNAATKKMPPATKNVIHTNRPIASTCPLTVIHVGCRMTSFVSSVNAKATTVAGAGLIVSVSVLWSLLTSAFAGMLNTAVKRQQLQDHLSALHSCPALILFYRASRSA